MAETLPPEILAKVRCFSLACSCFATFKANAESERAAHLLALPPTLAPDHGPAAAVHTCTRTQRHSAAGSPAAHTCWVSVDARLRSAMCCLSNLFRRSSRCHGPITQSSAPRSCPTTMVSACLTVPHLQSTCACLGDPQFAHEHGCACRACVPRSCPSSKVMAASTSIRAAGRAAVGWRDWRPNETVINTVL